MKSVRLGFFILLLGLHGTSSGAGLVFEARFVGVGELENLGTGEFFAIADNTTLQYQLWSGEVGGDSFVILGSKGQSYVVPFGSPQRVTLHGCDLNPRNPYSGERWPIPGAWMCDALKSFTVYEGVIEDPEVLELILADESVEIQIEIDTRFVQGEAFGSLFAVPEPSVGMVSSLGVVFLLMGNRRR